MPVIKILPIDILEGRATEALRQIARYDICDHSGEFESERFSHFAELGCDSERSSSARLGLGRILLARGVQS